MTGKLSRRGMRPVRKILPQTADPHGWAAKADAAEVRQDWDHAAEYWFRASTSLHGNPRDLRTHWQQREDVAKARSRIAS